ncbi:flagellar basal body-associated protein FliL [Agarivorans sp. MS3-6]|uniref:flagellar basal body-associated protein FliL n=1 Tax=Agarivorans sp. TSD2052 TaxID=2937286 RepID=UPI0020105FE6|nr:flagellar basal body-associated protein FliL [Agarivorans sp. TSD2052]UPW20014.1 flagellar basal body-associated protein FliL [Agarivorans sp. TSD2052]
MAEESELQVEDGEGGSKKKLFIIIGIVVVLLIGGVVGFLLMSGGDDQAPAAATPAAEATSSVTHTALYVGMPRPFVFNIVGDSRDRLVQIKVQLLVRGTDNEEMAKLHIPLIEGTLLSVFSAASVEDLSTQEGKDTLRENSLVETQKALKEITGKVVVEKILFTGFVMQ